MLQLIAIATLALPAAATWTSPARPEIAQEDDEAKKKPAPTPEEIERSLAALKEAFEQETPDQIAGAIQTWKAVPAEAIVEELVDVGLAHEAQPVVLATIEALGYLEHEAALEALHKYLKRNAKRMRDREDAPKLAPTLLAIGRHGNEESIDLLIDDIFLEPKREVVRARLMGLANIRVKRSVEELCDLMRKIDRRKVQPYANDFRLALVVLTGVDRGTDLDRWVQWWNDNKKTYEVLEKAPQMPEELQTRWDRYWGLQRQYQRQKRRGERGDDG